MKIVKTLMKSIREFKKESILAPVLVTFEVLLECMLPLYMVRMLDEIEVDGSIRNILFWGGLLLVMAAASLVFGMLAGKFSATASAGLQRTSARTSLPMCRLSRLPTSTSSPRPGSSPV